MPTKQHTAQPNGRRPKIVTIGGGTGHFTLLSGLKKHDVDITAIVSMMDNGGSTGELRDELGVLPPGDLRQCLVALSDADLVMRQLFAHRFDRGKLAGHTCGNLLISALEQITGSIDEAVLRAGDILKIRGRVVPVTRDQAQLVMTLRNGKVLKGEHAIDFYQLISRFGVASIKLSPKAKLNPEALWAIKEADAIVVGPGDLYTSILPNFLISGMPAAIRNAKAKKIFVGNLMNKHGQTDNMEVNDYIDVFTNVVGAPFFTHAIYNTTKVPSALLTRYLDEGEPVLCEPTEGESGPIYVGAPLLATRAPKRVKGDKLARSYIRHDQEKLAEVIVGLV
jgi:uncharacterized cofD-like protein